MALVSVRDKFIFVHIYKTGGNSIRSLLYTSGLGSYGIDYEEVGSPHISAAGVERILHAQEEVSKIWDTCFKFAVVRNPYTWMVSTYRFIQTTPGHRDYEYAQGSFEEFLLWVRDCGMSRRWISGGMVYDTQYGFTSAVLPLDYIIRFELFDVGVRDVMQRITGTKFCGDVPWENRQSYVEPVKSMVTPQCKKIIDTVFSKDFSFFGYKRDLSFVS